MSITDAYQSFEDDFLGPEPEYADEPLPIPDLAEADRALRRVARVRRQMTADQEVFDAELERLAAWLNARKETHAKAEAFHVERLERYHRAVLLLDPRAKTLTLPSGKLIARAQQPEWTWDDAAFIAWAAEHMPEAIRMKPAPAPEIDAKTAKALLTRKDEKGRVVAVGVTVDGVKPPGVEASVRGDKFDISFTEED